MLLGKSPLKIAFSYSTRRIRLGVAHHGAPAPIVPTKEHSKSKPAKKRR